MLQASSQVSRPVIGLVLAAFLPPPDLEEPPDSAKCSDNS